MIFLIHFDAPHHQLNQDNSRLAENNCTRTEKQSFAALFAAHHSIGFAQKVKI
jgi:hypothetical protein